MDIDTEGEGQGLAEGPAAFTGRLRLVPSFETDAKRPLHLLLVEDAGPEDYLVPSLLERVPDTPSIVTRAGSAETALRCLAHGGIDVCLIDDALPGRSGLDLVRLIQARGFLVPLLMLSDRGIELEEEAAAAGVDDVLERADLDAGRLERALRFAVARARRRAVAERAGQFDPLTGLALPVVFEDRIDRALAHVKRRGGHVAVLAIDLGDVEAQGLSPRGLKTLADRLSARLRETDTIARLGPRVWGVLLENLRAAKDGAVVATKARTTLSGPIEGVGGPVTLTPKLGLAVFPDDADTADDLLRRAGDAMRADGLGARLPGGDAPALSAAGLKAAFDDGRIALRYLPQMTLASPMIGLAAVPCLLDAGGHVLDISVQTMAETLDLHGPLMHWLIERGVGQLRAWAKAGMPRLHLALPLVARRDLAWGALADRTATALDQAGIDRHRVEFELDEARLKHEVETGGQGLRELREAGLRLALVGFGEGPASLKLLRDAPLDTVRLSPSLIEGVPQDRHRTVFLETVMHLIRMSQMRLVVEGTEDPSQLRFLRRGGCHAVQGIIGGPLDAEACTLWLRQAVRRQG